MKSAVYFASSRARSPNENKLNKIQGLFEAAGFEGMIRKGDLTALKVHFGEVGNDSYINPILIKPIAYKVKSLGARPTAIAHGFGCEVTGAPLIIADGLRSDYYHDVTIGQKHFSRVKIAGEIANANSMIVLSHFKAHLPAGFGGAIKNLGMGCAPAAGKAEQHSTKPIFNAELCSGCAACKESCPNSAITVEKKISSINFEVCTGCGKCLRICQTHAIDFNWFVDVRPFMERIAEYALGAVSGKEGQVGFFNFLINITPDCDCVPWSDVPLVADIGILASKDPVAIDQASFDLVNRQAGLENSLLSKNREPGKDKFRGVWESTLGNIQIDYGAEIGLGNKDYRLIEV